MKLTATFTNNSATAEPVTKATKAPIDPSVSSAGRNLAMAYKLDQLIARGLIADYTAAARLLGVSQPRLTHLMSLLLLAPTIQEAILAGTLAPGDKELRRLAQIGEWQEQLAAVGAVGR